MIRFIHILVDALNLAVSGTFPSKGPLMDLVSRPYGSKEALEILKLTRRIVSVSPSTLATAVNGYYTALAGISRYHDLEESSMTLVIDALMTPLATANTPG
jgi:hypothetical protein